MKARLGKSNIDKELRKLLSESMFVLVCPCHPCPVCICPPSSVPTAPEMEYTNINGLEAVNLVEGIKIGK